MIVKCKICKGSGRVFNMPLDFLGKVCPACKGAGEFEISISSENLTTCKFCNGNGIVQTILLPPLNQEVCPACKGIGIIERPTVGTQQTGMNEVRNPQSPRLSRYEYDIAVSFAGEDREIIKRYCTFLSSKGLKVFYDEYEQVDLWGKNLYDKLDEVYRTKALFCVLFISKYYAAKVWTNHERKSAQARALEENREYVLPVKLDDTKILGIPPTIGYLDIREVSVEKLAEITIQKVSNLKNRI